MKDLRSVCGILLAFASAIALSACGVTGGGAVLSNGQTAAVVGGAVAVDATRGMIYAELAYQTVAESALTATKAGLIHGDAAAKLQSYNRAALSALRLGKTTTDATARAQALVTLLGQIDLIRGLIPGGGS